MICIIPDDILPTSDIIIEAYNNTDPSESIRVTIYRSSTKKGEIDVTNGSWSVARRLIFKATYFTA